MADDLTFPWAREYGADQLEAFISDLWGAAGGDDGLAALDAIEKVIAEHRPPAVPAIEQAGPRTPCPLSDQQLTILTHIASGLTYRSAARKIGLSEAGLGPRMRRIYIRLGVHSAPQAVAMALHHGWLTADTLNLPQPQQRAPRFRATPRFTPQQWRVLYRTSAAQLRARPGEQLAIGPYRTVTGIQRATDKIRKGLIDDFAPAGSFEAEPDMNGDEWVIHARYIGQPTPERHTP